MPLRVPGGIPVYGDPDLTRALGYFPMSSLQIAGLEYSPPVLQPATRKAVRRMDTEEIETRES
jgi:hypothetical protein